LMRGLSMRKLKGLPGVGICSLCGEWHSLGEYFPSGEKNRRTGETPHDNFVCELLPIGGCCSSHAWRGV
jgi:hypothetical protein